MTNHDTQTRIHNVDASVDILLDKIEEGQILQKTTIMAQCGNLAAGLAASHVGISTSYVR